MISECSTQWFEGIHRILCDNYPNKMDLIFLHAEIKDNEDSNIKKSAKLYSEGFTNKIGITWADKSVLNEMLQNYEKVASPELIQTMNKALQPAEDGSIVGYMGFKHWAEKLTKLGVKKEDIITIKPSYEYYFSTNSESEGLINFCKTNRIKSVGISSSPFHQVRSYISDVSAILHQDYNELKAYSIPGENLNWTEEATHSQGIVKGTRTKILEGELEKIYKYHKSGKPPLTSLEEVIRYLNKRDII